MLAQKYEVFFSAASFLISEKMDLYNTLEMLTCPIKGIQSKSIGL